MKILTNTNKEPVQFKTFTFAGGEEYIKIEGYLGNEVTIQVQLSDSKKVMQLVMAVDAIRNMNSAAKITLLMAYCPYARQDRVCNTGESHSLRVFANLINRLNFEKVIVFDPHSDVVGALIDNIVIVKQRRIFDEFAIKNAEHYSFFSNCLLVSPDAGANKKTFELAQYFGHKAFIRADKQRNLLDGKIGSVEIVTGKEYIKGMDVLIVDDICDGGGTFIMLANELKKYSPKSISLYVTHGIFSKGVDVLHQAGISNIYTTNSFQDITETSNLFVADINYVKTK